MKILGLFKLLTPYFSDSKTMIGVILCCSILWQHTVKYVDAKHIQGMQLIEESSKRLQEAEKREIQSQAALKSIEKSLSDMSDTIKIMDHRVWEMYKISDAKRVTNVFSN